MPQATVVAGAFALVSASTVIRFLRDVAIEALRTARLNEGTDPPTGLANRRGLQRTGSLRWGECAMARQPLAPLVIDVDHVKRINDVYGHAGGHENLRRIAERIRTVVQSELVTVSIGAHEACRAPGDALRPLWSAIDQADLALYEAKRTGRNRVVNSRAGD